MGGYWAYKTLGWGGYWGWDPVENTSLVPWLFTAALVHGMFLQRSRKRHRKVNLLLACTAYATILYGTFLTRSGVLADFSVHSFIDLGITGWLVAILGAFLGLSIVAAGLALAVDPGRTEEEETPLLSRSVLFILGIAIFCALGLRDPARHLRPAPDAPVGRRRRRSRRAFYGKTTTPAGVPARAARRASSRSSPGRARPARGSSASARRSLVVAAVVTAAGLRARGADRRPRSSCSSRRSSPPT